MLKGRISHYIASWKDKGYPDGIPDEVPEPLMKLRIAPSYKAIAMAILSNDLHLSTLGYSRPRSKYYSILKKIELEDKNDNHNK